MRKSAEGKMGKSHLRQKKTASLKPIFEIDESTIVDEHKFNNSRGISHSKEHLLNSLERSSALFEKTPNNSVLKRHQKHLSPHHGLIQKPKKNIFIEEEEMMSSENMLRKLNRKPPPVPTKKRNAFLSDTDHSKVKKQTVRSPNEKRNEDDLYFYMLDRVVASYGENECQ